MSIKFVKFEVSGKVQGVFFRKYTKKFCEKYNVRGWVLNTDHRTVQGVLEGSEASVRSVKHWLQKVGSPKSRIDRCVFLDEKIVQTKQFSAFKIITDDQEVKMLTF
uniref:acylphosphatase n=1 Tax=Phallusia mammillata TaxID=59560 RepID=A0A6F9D6G1_9ASCI|nr:acylphosphatase-2-like [Phallusia mammillata]